MGITRQLLIILLTGIIFSSCTLITDPDRIYNQNAHPPQAYSFNFDEIPPGKHINGTVIVNFDPPDIPSDVRSVRIFVDDTLRYSASKLPCQVFLYTYNYPEGTHLLSFYVYLDNDSTGLLNVLGAPSRIYETTVYVDRTPPDTVVISEPAAGSNGIQINWTESVNLNFYAYILYKAILNDEFTAIDTIYNKTGTSYVDTEKVNLVGVKYRYRVDVATDPELITRASSNIAAYIFGQKIKYNFTHLQGGPFLSEKQSRFYFLADNKLISFSTVDESLVQETQLSGLFAGSSGSVTCTFNRDESRIYLYKVSDNILSILNSSDLSVIKTLVPDQGGGQLLVPDNNRIVFNDYDGIRLIDINNNVLLKSLILNRPVLLGAELNEDRTRLITCHSVNSNGGFYIIDLANNELNITDSVQINRAFLELKTSGNLLCGDGKWLYNSNTCELIGGVSPSNEISYFSMAADRIAISAYDSFPIIGFGMVPYFKISICDGTTRLLDEKYVIGSSQTAVTNNKLYVRVDTFNLPGPNILGYVINYGD